MISGLRTLEECEAHCSHTEGCTHLELDGRCTNTTRCDKCRPVDPDCRGRCRLIKGGGHRILPGCDTQSGSLVCVTHRDQTSVTRASSSGLVPATLATELLVLLWTPRAERMPILLARYGCLARLHLDFLVSGQQLALCHEQCTTHGHARCRCYRALAGKEYLYLGLSNHTLHLQGPNQASHRNIARHLCHHNPRKLGLFFLHFDHWVDWTQLLPIIDRTPNASLLASYPQKRLQCHRIRSAELESDEWFWWNDARPRCAAACEQPQLGCTSCCTMAETMFFLPHVLHDKWLELVGTIESPGPFWGVYMEVAIPTMALYLSHLTGQALTVLDCIGGPVHTVSWDVAASSLCTHKVDLAHPPSDGHPALLCRHLGQDADSDQPLSLTLSPGSLLASHSLTHALGCAQLPLPRVSRDSNLSLCSRGFKKPLVGAYTPPTCRDKSPPCEVAERVPGAWHEQAWPLIHQMGRCVL